MDVPKEFTSSLRVLLRRHRIDSWDRFHPGFGFRQFVSKGFQQVSEDGNGHWDSIWLGMLNDSSIMDTPAEENIMVFWCFISIWLCLLGDRKLRD